jgi:hypothetical protein
VAQTSVCEFVNQITQTKVCATRSDAMSRWLRYQSIVFGQVIAACAFSTAIFAQEQLPHLPAPPPMHLVTKSDRSQLDGARDPKARLKANMALAIDHLTQAEKLTNDKKFDEASAALGSYLGVIGDLRDYIATLDQNKGSTRDLYRHFEMEVRPHIPRLAIIQRTTPASYVRNIKDAEEFIIETRSEALESFYGNSVLREPPLQNQLAPPAGGPNNPTSKKAQAPDAGGPKDPAQPKRP